MPISEQCWRAGPARALRMALLAGVALTLAGCLQTGESLVEDELARVRTFRDFGVVSASPERAVLAARGRRVVVEPAPGSCIAPDSVEVSRSLVFLVVSDCVIERVAALDTADADGVEMQLPAAFPGVITISVSGVPMDDAEGGGAASAEKLRAFLQSDKGRAQLGRGSDALMVEIEESRVVGDTLYVLIHDRGAEAVPLLAPQFWRAFAEVNGRMVLATVSGFNDRPMSSEAMLRKLASQVAALRAANGLPRGEAVAGELPAALPPERVDDRATKIAPFLSPDVPPPPRAVKRRGTAASVAPVSASARPTAAAPAAEADGGSSSRQAPTTAPGALRRPKAGA